MKIYLFGNPDYEPDSLAFKVAEKLILKFPELEFITVKPNEDLPFEDNEKVIIMDTVMGIEEVTLITERDLDKFQLPPRYSAHDFDLGFQLKYLRKLGRISEFNIIGLPMRKEIEKSKVIFLVRKLLDG